MVELDNNQLIQICVNTFAKYHQFQPTQIQVLSYADKSINLQPAPEPGQVNTGDVSKCIYIDANSPIGRFFIYMRKSGKGNVYWKQQ